MIEVQALLKTIFESKLARFLTRTLSWDLKRAYLRDACKIRGVVLHSRSEVSREDLCQI